VEKAKNSMDPKNSRHTIGVNAYIPLNRKPLIIPDVKYGNYKETLLPFIFNFLTK